MLACPLSGRWCKHNSCVEHRPSKPQIAQPAIVTRHTIDRSPPGRYEQTHGRMRIGNKPERNYEAKSLFDSDGAACPHACRNIDATTVGISVVWNKTYAARTNDSASALLSNQAGEVISCRRDQTFGAGEGDAWVVNPTGDRGRRSGTGTIGAGEADTARALINTTDGNYLVAGSFTYQTNDTQEEPMPGS